MANHDEKWKSYEIGGDACIRGAELENGARVNILSPATTIEVLTQPNLITLEHSNLGFEFVAGIGPKAVETGRKVCGDDVYLVWSEIPWSAGRAAIVMVDQFDGLSSGEKDNFNKWLDRVKSGRWYSSAHLLQYEQRYSRMLEDFGDLAKSGASMDADSLAVMLQRAFYNPESMETGFLQWTGSLNVGLTEVLEKTPPQFRKYLMKDYLSTMTRQFVQTRSRYGSGLQQALSRMSWSYSNDNVRELGLHWGDSIFTTGIYVMCIDDTEPEETLVVSSLVRSLADSNIAWIYSLGGRQEQSDVLNVDANKRLDQHWGDIPRYGGGIFSRQDCYYTNIFYPYTKIGGAFASRNQLYDRMDTGRRIAAPNSATLALCQVDSPDWEIGEGARLDVFHMSDGAYYATRNFEREAPKAPDILAVAQNFGSDPTGYLKNKHLSKPADDWVVAMLSFK